MGSISINSADFVTSQSPTLSLITAIMTAHAKFNSQHTVSHPANGDMIPNHVTHTFIITHAMNLIQK